RSRTLPNETAQPGARFAGAIGDAAVLIPLYIGLHIIGFGRGLNVGVGAVYAISLTAVWGATLGKRMAHTQVVRAADNGKVGWARATVRHAVFAAPTFVLLLFGVEPWPFLLIDNGLILVRKDRRALHDLVAGTRVVNVPAAPARSAVPRTRTRAGVR